MPLRLQGKHRHKNIIRWKLIPSSGLEELWLPPDLDQGDWNLQTFRGFPCTLDKLHTNGKRNESQSLRMAPPAFNNNKRWWTIESYIMEYQLKDVTNGMTSNSKHYRGICRKISQNKTFEYVNPILQYDWHWLPIVLVYQYCMEKFWFISIHTRGPHTIWQTNVSHHFCTLYHIELFFQRYIRTYVWPCKKFMLLFYWYRSNKIN